MADYWVDSSVPGPGSGTLLDPWDDIATNINSLGGGDRMLMRGGAVIAQVYNEPEINITVNNITLEPYQAELVEIQKNSYGEALDIDGDDVTVNGKNQLRINKNGTGGYGIRVDGAHVTLNDFEIYDISGAGSDALIFLSSTSTNALIDGCTIHDAFQGNTSDSGGVGVNGASQFTIQNCTIYDCYGDGIIIDDGAATGYGWAILNNTIYTTLAECSENGIDAKWNTASGQATIIGNTFYGFHACTSTCGGTGDPAGAAISVHNSCDNTLVANNTIYDCTSGIAVSDSVQDVTVRNNLIHDLHDEIQDPNATHLTALFVWGSNIDIFNNTIHNAPVHTIKFPNEAEFDLSNVIFRNNIFNDGGAIRNEAFSGWTADYNCWFNCSETLSGGNDVTDDPLFTDEGSDDYTLSAGSPCRDVGVDLGLPYRGSAPDMGAFEYETGATVFVTVMTVVVVAV